MASKNWQDVVEQLLQGWRERPGVEAVLLFGSCAQGAAKDGSDVDLSVILSPGVVLDEPGLRVIDGWVVEVFTGTRAFFESHFERFHKDNSRIAQRQFASAKVLFDRGGEAKKIQQTAREWLAKDRVRQDGSWSKREIWSGFRRLEQIAEEGRADLAHAFHAFVQSAYAKYAAFLGEPVMEGDRVYSYSTDEGMRERYLMEAFGDAEFGRLMVEAIGERDAEQMIERARKLKEHAIERMGGLEIPGA